jgi:F-type H+-transporting ATPase subunit gamma
VANVRDYRTRIRSVRSTQQITRAMKLVSAAKLRRAQERIIAARPYALKMRQVLTSLAARAKSEGHPLLARTAENDVLVAVITADRGFCGSFNSNILNEARRFLNEIRSGTGRAAGRTGPPERLRVDVVGKKARDWFRRRDFTVRRTTIDIFRALGAGHARDLATDLVEGFTGGEFDAVYMVYNEFKSAIQQRPIVEKLLPIPRDYLAGRPAGAAVPGMGDIAALAAAPEEPGPPAGGASEDYIYEPEPALLFDALLPRHVEVQVYHALLESSAAEHGARMTAMENATRNAGEMIDTLTLQMNKIRQASITKEILEVVSGAEALT